MSAHRDEPAPESAHAGDLPVLLLDSDGRVVASSPSAARHLDRSGDELRGRKLLEIFQAASIDHMGWMQSLASCREPPPPRLLDLELVRKDGMQLGFDGVLYAIAVGPRAAGQAVAGLKIRPSGGLVLKSELLMAQREVLGLVAQGADLRKVLTAVAAFAERAMPGEAFCLLSPLDDDGRFEPGLCPTLPQEISQLQAGRRAGDDGSPAAVAAESGRRILAHDVEQVDPWREFGVCLHRHGLVACWAMPIRSARSDRVRAVLEFLLPVRRLPSRVELALLEELAEMVRLSLDLHGLAAELATRSVAQRQAEVVAEQREVRMAALVDTALDAVISIADDGTITLWNRQAETLFGWQAREVLGKPLSDFIVPPEMRKAHHAGLQRAVATGTGALLGRRIEISTMDRVGRRFPVELSINRMPGAQGGFSAFLRDISERRRSETAIKSSEERLKLVIDASADGIWDLRLDGGASMASDRCASMLGHDPALSSPWAPPENPWVHPEDRAGIARAWKDHLEGRTPRFESEHRRRSADGTLRWVLERAKVVERDAQGRVQRVVGVVTDVTERRALEESLSSAERLESLGLLAGGFAGELDELLSGIGAHVTLTKIAPGIPTRVSEGLEVVQALVGRAKSMARSLMGLAPNRRVDAAIAVVGVAQTLREALPLLRAALPRTIELELEDRSQGRDLVRLDPADLQQAMLQLVMRASEALGHSGQIRVRIRAEGRMLHVECLDSAVAMTAEQCADIAEALDGKGRLTGRAALGMAAVRRFAEAAGGALRAEVRAEGNVVVIDLPLEPESVPLQQPPVILCEDHPLLRPMIAEAITAAGHRVVTLDRIDDMAVRLREEGAGTVLVLDARAWAGLRDAWASLCEGLGWNPPVVLMLDDAPGTLPAGVQWLRRPVAVDALTAAISGRAGGDPPRP
jgi:PAS domain S-box-containing protein